MAEKREGRELKTSADAIPSPPALFQTTDYRVIYGRVPPDKTYENEQDPRLFRYIIQHKTHGVVYGTAGGFGQAIVAAVQAQVELGNALETAQAYAQRNYKVEDEKTEGSVPRFQ